MDRSWNQQDTWRQMEEVYRSGKAKAIGVSNWSIPYLEHLQKTWTVVPAVNQVCCLMTPRMLYGMVLTLLRSNYTPTTLNTN